MLGVAVDYFNWVHSRCEDEKVILGYMESKGHCIKGWIKRLFSQEHHSNFKRTNWKPQQCQRYKLGYFLRNTTRTYWTPQECQKDKTPQERQKDRLDTTGTLKGQTGHYRSIERTGWIPQKRQRDRLDTTGMPKGQTGNHSNAKGTNWT